MYGREGQEGDEGNLVAVSAKETVTAHEITINATATRPPPRYSEATLLSAMEVAGKMVDDEELKAAMAGRGLGTPATRAQIIENLIGETYMLRDGKELIPTAKAFSLITLLRGLGANELTSPELTGEWEHKLAQMERGALSRAEFMEHIQAMTRDIVERAKRYESDTVPGDFATLATPCPKCGGVVKENYKKFACQSCDWSAWKIVAGRQFEIDEIETLLREGKVDYMIENPTVVEYYINGLGFTDLVKRGSTSKDSFVYFGINRQQPELASIIDKVLPLINFEDMKYAGMQSVPTLRNEESRQLGSVIIGLALALGVILFVTVRIVRSLSDQKAQTRFLKEREQLLYTDVLTGFHNRNYFSHNAEALQKGEYPQAILVADLNNLKRVNDAYGHAAGDALLRLFAAYIRELFPEGNVFRIGGDEFIILLDRTSKEAALKAIEALQAKCANVGYTVKDGQMIHPSAAMGYAIRNHDLERLDDLIARADERMYQAKARMKKRRSDRQEPVPETNGDQ